MKIKAAEQFVILRIKKGYSITGLAHKMGVNPSVVFKMEKGQPVRPATAKKACKALDEEFETLFIIEK